MAVKLTKSLIDKFSYEKSDGKQDIRWDSQISGFGVRLYASGKKTFIIAYRVLGQKRIMTLGRYGIITLDQAREEAIRTLACTLNGKDPLLERKALSKAKTIREFGAEYMRRHETAHNKGWKRVERRLNRHIVSSLGARAITSIGRNDITTLHSEISQSAPYEANRVLALLSSMFERAKEWGYFQGDNPARKIKKNREKRRDRWVTAEELPRLIKAINNEENIYARSAILLYLFTGLRKSELLHAKWEDLDWQQRSLRIPETKADRVHHIPLSEPAMKIMRELPRIEDNPYILAGRKSGAPIVNLDKPWFRIRQAADLEDVRLHDLRRTVGSSLAQQGSSLHLIGRVLNHSNPRTTQVYAHFTEENVRAALDSHAERLNTVVQQTQEASEVKPECRILTLRQPEIKRARSL